MADPLEQFRKKPAQTESAAASTVPKETGYVAFKAVDKRQTRLKIRPGNRAWERVSYAYLLRVVEDGSFGTQIALVYTFMVVIIKGRNLQAIADAIDNEQCDVVWEYDIDRWEKPTAADAPFIESIEFHIEKPADAVYEMHKGSATDGSRH